MSDPQNGKLQEAIRNVIGKIKKFQDRNIGEQNTKASLIEPILEALGWDVRDPDEVFREFKPTSVDCPVDYALTILRKPRLFVEAKGLGETLSNRKWVTQVLSYATVAGVEWCILTDGDEYRFYNATAPLDAEEKLFWHVRLTEDAEAEVTKALTLISRCNMEENLLDMLWNAHYVDRRVKQALQELISTPDKSLIRLIRIREPKLSPKDIAESFRRLDPRFEPSTPIPNSALSFPTPPSRPKKLRPNLRKHAARDKKHPKQLGVTLTDLISGGYLNPPVRLFCKYLGGVLEATLQPDGAVEFQGKRFPSCSTAAEHARSTVTGRRMHTNGWIFWQFLDGNGKKKTLSDARAAYMHANGHME